MAEDPSNDVTAGGVSAGCQASAADEASVPRLWLLEIAQQHLDYLGPVRHWQQLKIAASPGVYWVKGLTEEQLNTVEIKSIPFKHIYYALGQLLFPYGGFVPVKKLPASLLWTPLERGLPLSLPSFNHNYFGIHERLDLRLVASGKEEDAVALLTSLEIVGKYIQSAPAVRLKSLSWVIIDDQALLFGKPLLPLPGGSYWRKSDFLLPAGLDWEWTALAETLGRQLDPDGTSLLLWDRDGRYLAIFKEQFRPLSISSFRLSMPGSSFQAPNRR